MIREIGGVSNPTATHLIYPLSRKCETALYRAKACLTRCRVRFTLIVKMVPQAMAPQPHCATHAWQLARRDKHGRLAKTAHSDRLLWAETRVLVM